MADGTIRISQWERRGPVAARRATLRREATRAIKDAALAQLREHGAVGLSLRAVAREAGMSAPGLYRYFASRDALLTALIVDGYDAMADHILVATGRPAEELSDLDRPRPAPALAVDPDADVRERFLAAALAYREWGVQHPNEFGLLFGDPIPGYAAPADGPTVAAMTRMATALGRPLVEAWLAGRLRPLDAESLAPAAGALAKMADFAEGSVLPPEVAGTLLATWGRLHGGASLEVFGHHHWIFPDGALDLFRADVLRLLHDLGIDVATDPETPR
jgi:AcrR family transcriptional regulator